MLAADRASDHTARVVENSSVNENSLAGSAPREAVRFLDGLGHAGGASGEHRVLVDRVNVERVDVTVLATQPADDEQVVSVLSPVLIVGQLIHFREQLR